MAEKKTTSQKHAELKGLAKQSARNIWDMLRLAVEILADLEYIDKFGGEGPMLDLLEAEEFIHFGGDPSLTAMLRAYRANPQLAKWQEYRFNVRAMIELARAAECKNAREARKVDEQATLDQVQAVLAEVARKYAGNVGKAVETAESEVRKIKGFRDIAPQFIRHALQERIYDLRHEDNTKQRQSQFTEGSPYNYCLGGTVLARLKGEQLEELAASEEDAAKGHAFNARVCKALLAKVSNGKTVKQVLSEEQLQRIMDASGE